MTYTRRYVDDFLDRAMEHLPSFMITGPRACGKTTTASRRAASTLRLDVPAQAALFRGDPDATLARLETPVLIDESQEEPQSLAAVKRAVDTGKGAGRFLVTGSTRGRLQGATWPGTGRLTPVRMYPMAEGEIRSSDRAPSFLDRLFEADLEAGQLGAAPTIFDYLPMTAAGGFPEARGMPDDLRSTWFSGYVDQLVGRDLPDIAAVRDPQKITAVLQTAALSTSGIPTKQTLARTADVDHRTVDRHLDLLTEVGIVELLPAWGQNRLARMSKSPKVHLTDTGLAMHLIGADAEVLTGDGDLRGRILESFVVEQLRPLLQLGRHPVTAHHLRDTDNRREVDLVLESRRGNVVGIEVKAAAGVTPKDTRHLSWLRDQIGDSFRCGLVLHTGDLTYQVSDRIWAAPIAAIWS